MESGVPGATGVAVLRPVEEVRRPDLGNVILLLQLMEGMTALMMGSGQARLKTATVIHVKVRIL